MANKNFDFYEHAYDVVKQKWGYDGISYHEVYSYMGRRFSLKKTGAKKAIKRKGYLIMLTYRLVSLTSTI